MPLVRLCPRSMEGLIGVNLNGDAVVDGVRYAFGANVNLTGGVHSFAVSAGGAQVFGPRVVPPAGTGLFVDDLAEPARPAVGAAESFRAGEYYGIGAGLGAYTSGSVSNDALRVTPWDVESPVTVADLGVIVTTAGSSGAVARLGVFADDGSGAFPGALAVDAGTVNAAATGAPVAANLGVVLRPGRYWAGAVVQGSPTTQPALRVANLGAGLYSRLPGLPTSGSPPTSVPLGWIVNGVSGALPVVFPTAGVSSMGVAPVLFFRAG